jgi:hypothetical protein
MSDARRTTPDPAPRSEPAATRGEDLRCDFCGRQVARVRRVALDGDYERLRTRHQVRYACPDCSERKELERRS